MDDLQTALKELGQAIYNHEQWHKDLTRVLVCHLPCDQRDVAVDAHRQCRFGQWYYGSGVSRFRDHAGFTALALEHERMHAMAARLLQASESEASVPPIDYENFNNALERLRLQLQELKLELEYALYNRDTLTGAENRIGMVTKLREQLELVKRHVQQCCLVLMDLDHFKKVNDSAGHLAGDQVLAGAVRHIKDHLRPYDKVFRYGGEEFLIVLPNTSLQAGRDIIERIREGLSAIALAHAAGEPVFVTASFGMTPLAPDVTIEESMDRADKAMYAAKTAGRNCLRLWEPAGGG
ncbi:MAG: diguanylate cyclase [Acidobacteriia bacterium]|nr:diguanylate cyclase [Terriglobia bacterium]